LDSQYLTGSALVSWPFDQQPSNWQFQPTPQAWAAAAAGVRRRGRAHLLARELDCSHPGAAASLREVLAETLTMTQLGVPPTLARTLRRTNAIESMIDICRNHAANARALAGRADGAALDRRRDGRDGEAVPPRQRPSVPTRPAGRIGRNHQRCHTEQEDAA
jgi:hypothetical protein